jgi:formylglycine-generating enzyme required for sulfatase activity
LRGGSWYLSARNCRCATRYYFAPGYRLSYFGLRIALDFE